MREQLSHVRDRVKGIVAPKTAERQIVDFSSRFIIVPLAPPEVGSKNPNLPLDGSNAYEILDPEERDQLFRDLDSHAHDLATQSTRADINLD